MTQLLSHLWVGGVASGPEGIEARWEFNGLTLNDRRYLEVYRVAEIDLGHPDIRTKATPHPGAHGEVAYRRLLGGRTITLSGMIEAGNLGKLRAMRNDLYSAVETRTEKPLYCRGLQAGDTYINCRLASISVPEAQSNDRFQRPFQVAFRASNPRFLSTTETSSSAQTIAQDTSTFTVTNSGNFEAEPTIIINKGSGQVRELFIKNQANGDSILFSGTIFDGAESVVTIYNSATERIVEDDLGYLRWSDISPVSTPTFSLVPGANTIEMKATEVSGSPTLQFKHRHSYL